MLKSLHIKNFQSHKETFVEFSPNVTCFTGLNNHGKSVILRALFKIIRNDPDGVTFISDTPVIEQDCSIVLVTDRGKVERRVKRGNVVGNNMYIVNDSLEFSNFSKTGIPKEVLEILDISEPIEFGGISIDLNFQNQFDLMFLTQGDGLASLRGKVLGKVTNIDDINRAIQIGASEEKQLKKDISILEDNLEKNKKEKELYSDLTSQERSLGDIKQHLIRSNDLQELIKQVNTKKEEILSIVKNAKAYQNKIECIERIKVNDKILLIECLLKKIFLLKKLFSLQKSIFHYRKIYDLQIAVSQRQIYEKFQRVQLLILVIKMQLHLHTLNKYALLPVNIDLPLIYNLYTQYTSMLLLNNNISNLQQNINFNNAQIRQYMDTEIRTEQEFFQLKRELKICPTCGEPFHLKEKLI
jgi:predicted ATP-dependent endonuclease of OLD family